MMATENRNAIPTTAGRQSIRLPRPLWILVGTLAVVATTWGVSTWRQASAVNAIRRSGGVVAYASDTEFWENAWNCHDLSDTSPVAERIWDVDWDDSAFRMFK